MTYHLLNSCFSIMIARRFIRLAHLQCESVLFRSSRLSSVLCLSCVKSWKLRQTLGLYCCSGWFGQLQSWSQWAVAIPGYNSRPRRILSWHMRWSERTHSDHRNCANCRMHHASYYFSHHYSKFGHSSRKTLSCGSLGSCLWSVCQPRSFCNTALMPHNIICDIASPIQTAIRMYLIFMFSWIVILDYMHFIYSFNSILS